MAVFNGNIQPKVITMSNMKCFIKCPMCGEVLQKYGEIDPDAGTSIVLGANCPKCGIGNSDIKLWQALIDSMKEHDLCHDALVERTKELDRTRKALDEAIDTLCWYDNNYDSVVARNTLDEIKIALKQKDVK